jgi:hypothetical protein
VGLLENLLLHTPRDTEAFLTIFIVLVVY